VEPVPAVLTVMKSPQLENASKPKNSLVIPFALNLLEPSVKNVHLEPISTQKASANNLTRCALNSTNLQEPAQNATLDML
jgi:hypothetical protein